MNSIAVQIPDDTAARLDRLAEKPSRPADSVAADAIEAFLAREEWQLAAQRWPDRFRQAMTGTEAL
jgi:predicted transcriptional regulator